MTLFYCTARYSDSLCLPIVRRAFYSPATHAANV